MFLLCRQGRGEKEYHAQEHGPSMEHSLPPANITCLAPEFYIAPGNNCWPPGQFFPKPRDTQHRECGSLLSVLITVVWFV